MCEVRPKEPAEPVRRFETPPGAPGLGNGRCLATAMRSTRTEFLNEGDASHPQRTSA